MDQTTNIHGVAIAVGDLGLLILGASGAGKSCLAARMMAEWPFGRVSLVADDRVLLTQQNGRIVARPHPEISGQMELRGIGIVPARSLEAIVINGAVKLGAVAPTRLPESHELVEILLGVPLPCASLPEGYAAYARLVTIWPYLRPEMLRD